ncbi:MAG TPA: hypothetical protein VFA91_01810 [Candidatus Polarisedimenticolia bacterium]|jgi:hypothetical protein|nr:hypothetical protein [Dongiaceae bacterium]HYV87284.1 hypothetical protein [Candidatus Polarisedimenticolia bacterium]
MTTRAAFLLLSSIYLAGMAWVWAGVFAASGFTYIGLFAVFLPSAVFWFSAGWFVLFLRDWRLPLPRVAIPDGVIMGLLAAAALASLIQFIALGQIPLLIATRSSDYLEIARIRQSINYGSPIFNYLSPLLVKVIYPILAIAFFKMGRTGLAVIALLLGMAYGASLMQKSYPLYVALPAAAYLGLSRRFAAAVGTATLACVVVVAMATIANPPGPASVASGGTVTLPARKAIGAGLAHRILLTPGETVVQWFDAFPAVYPFEHGCGYRFAAPVLGCRFVNNADLIYLQTSPEYVSQGLKGEMNAAHFSEEYANFGSAGLALSAFLAAFVLLIAAVLTAGLGAEIALSINIPFIAILTSTALHTTLLSGGWAAAIALSLILLGRAQQPHQ